MTHRWIDRVEAADRRSSRMVCDKCGMIRVSRHETEGGREQHWKEYFRGTARVHHAATPACEPQTAEVEA